MSEAQVYAGAALIGTVAGMRSMTAPAIVSRIAGAAGINVDKSGVDFLHNPVIPRVMSMLAFGEFIADKLPFVPSRTTAFPLITRAISGAVSGAALCSSKKRSPTAGSTLRRGGGRSREAMLLTSFAGESSRICTCRTRWWPWRKICWQSAPGR